MPLRKPQLIKMTTIGQDPTYSSALVDELTNDRRFMDTVRALTPDTFFTYILETEKQHKRKKKLHKKSTTYAGAKSQKVPSPHAPNIASKLQKATGRSSKTSKKKQKCGTKQMLLEKNAGQ